jgi:DNA mismatch repair protein MutS2
VNSHTLRILEYPAVLDRLACHCRSAPGKRKAAGLNPITDVESLNLRLDLISEMIDLFKFDGGPPDLEFGDLAMRLEQAASSGQIFEPKELLDYSAFFKTVFDCQRLKEKYKRLREISSGLVYPQDLHREIERSIDISGNVKDSASPELKRIRRELRLVKEKLNEKFEKYLYSETASFLSDNLFTVREGRYVLPVRETDKAKVAGIIHDRSSGATFFIEPAETVELNNRHRELETAEREEVNRILRYLSEMLYMNLDVVREDVELLSRLDFIAGCSRLSMELRGSRPLFSDSRELNIKSGRHPVLVLNAARDDNSIVVPLTVTIANDSNILIVTGPNTGGKTVALKTIGLLSLMAASGLFVPADEKSTFVLFEKMFADIGDEQSIDSSLSTYSSHLNHIKTAIVESDSQSLVLLDELGAGTDPDEGSAIGQAVVELLSRKGCYAVITTHHGKLKALAGKVEGVVNGSMEFDSENLKPTFRFWPGIPGSSYAVEIARRLGLSEEVTDRAWQLLDSKERDVTRLISELGRKSAELSNQLESARSDSVKYRSLVKIFEEKLDSLKKAEKELRKSQLEKTAEIVRETKDELDRLIKTARERSKDEEALRRVRKGVSEKLEKTRAEIHKLTPSPVGEQARGLPGEKVHIVGIGAEGEILEAADSMGRVKVRVGNINMVTELDNLLRKSPAGKPTPGSSARTDYSPEPGLDLDIRGMTFDEAEPLIQRYIDDACNAGLEQVTIIHGKGTGALRKKVQDFLAHSQRVASFRLGNWDEGSTGVTVLTIKAE